MKFIIALLIASTCCASPSESEYLKYLKFAEGYKLTPYNDRGNAVVGVGHNLTVNNDTPKALYSEKEIAAFFRKDLAKALTACRSGISNFDSLPDPVQLVTVGLVWSVGPAGFKKFKNYRAHLSLRQYIPAAMELYGSKWFGQVGPERAQHAVRVIAGTK